MSEELAQEKAGEQPKQVSHTSMTAPDAGRWQTNVTRDRARLIQEAQAMLAELIEWS